MTHRILVVDDSSFFLTRLKEIINEHPDLEVIACASNGQEAIDLDEKLKPDVITMDYEMPGINGIAAMKEILSKRRVPIIMFSSMTSHGARITLDSLEAGAVDFLPKSYSDVSGKSNKLKTLLHKKLVTFAQNSKPSTPRLQLKKASTDTPAMLQSKSATINSTQKASSRASKFTKLPEVLVIGASTGGPVAVSKIVCRLGADFPIPIVVIQHMPAEFTEAFAARLDQKSDMKITEAKNGDKLEPGSVLIAPGGKQLMFASDGQSIKVFDGDERVDYKPSVDIAFASAAKTFDSNAMAIVLTGMGSDGCDGARLLKNKDARVWAQDEDSSVVFGMPAAVAKAGLVDMVLPIDDFAQNISACV